MLSKAPGQRYVEALAKMKEMIADAEAGDRSAMSCLVHSSESGGVTLYIERALRTLEPLAGIRAVDDARSELHAAYRFMMEDLSRTWALPIAGITTKDTERG